MTKQVPKPVDARYGMLTVLRYDSPIGWLVRCDCGTEKHYGGHHLRSLQYSSCGCSRYKRHGELMRQRHQRAKAANADSAAQTCQPAKSGTRCWCCRAFTGKTEPVALCRVCEGKKS